MTNIPPFQEQADGPGGWRSVAQLFLVPLLIVVVAGGVFVAMTFLVGDQPDPEEILQKVSSGDSRRRGQAAFELAMRIRAEPEILEDVSFRARLLAVYQQSNTDAEIRRYLTQVLSMASMPEATEALLDATRDPDPDTQLYAVAALGNAAAPEAYERLVELTRAEDPGLRSVAVVALVALERPDAIPVLEARLTDSAVEVAWNAANALAHLGSTAGEAVLRQMLDESHLRAQPNITENQMERAMLTALEGLTQLQRQSPDPERLTFVETVAQATEFSQVKNAAMLAIVNLERLRNGLTLAEAGRYSFASSGEKTATPPRFGGSQRFAYSPPFDPMTT